MIRPAFLLSTLALVLAPSLASVLAPVLTGPAMAATLKPYTALSAGVVRLNDLFEGADARPLGPAPAPGGRITVESPQLLAIARMFGVDWRPAGPGDRAVLERPGRSLSHEDVLPPLRALLEAEGAPRDSDIELPAVSTALFPSGIPPTLEFSGTAYDGASGRFTTLLQATSEGMPAVQVRLSGRVQAMTELPVPRRAMMPGDVVAAEDLQWTRMRVGLARGEPVRTPAQAVGQALRHPVQAGQPILVADLGRPVVVYKGTPLALSLEGPGLQVTAQGVAAEPGGLGERIRVLNTYSRATLEAEITGPGTARVVPGGGQRASAGPGQLTNQVAVR